MFRGTGVLLKLVTITFLVTRTCGEDPTPSNSRSYDTNDWIPVNRPAKPGEINHPEDAHKKPTGRVLNLPLRDEKQYYPADQQIAQNYRLPLEPARSQQPPLLQNQKLYHPQSTYIPNSQQQILLPPQLQSLITQGEPYITPQKLNQQLLRTQNHEYPTLPTQHSPPLLNYSKENIQNFNIRQHNQQNIRQNINQQPEVQLLYVPLENLQRQHEQNQQQIAFPAEQTVSVPQVYNPGAQQQYESPVQHKQVQLHNIEQEFVQQALQAQKLQEQFQQNVQPVAQQSYRRPYPEITSPPQTTPAPKKRKPHQPPLAVYMGTEKHQEVKIGDVLSLLKDAKTISVQDTVGPDSPQVFVGPSHLEPPEGYAKFDLPYLSSIENNRVERKVDHLPFFVAPLSYKAPPGYSKIPFPAPHVGSVVINQLKISPSTNTEKSKYVSLHTFEETSSQIPFSQPEISTVRATRGRQRQQINDEYYQPSAQSSLSADIPYGPLPTRSPEIQKLHLESSTSPNPYGPTRFIQTTTPIAYEKPVALPEEIFSTKNRFSTTSAYDSHKVKYSHRPAIVPTEPTVTPSTLSATLTNDKYTILEQFPIREKQAPQQTENRGTDRQVFRIPSIGAYNTDSSEEVASPLISDSQFSTHNFGTQDSNQQYHQKDSSKRHRVVQNNKDISSKPVYRDQTILSSTESYQEVPSRSRVTENYRNEHQSTRNTPVQQALLTEQVSTQQSNLEFELPVRHSTQQTQIGKLQEFLSPNYKHRLPSISNPERTVQTQTQKNRGQQHFTTATQDEYEQYFKEKTTEPYISVTKEPVVEYKIHNDQFHHTPSTRNQQQIQESYYREEPQQYVISSNQEYTLPDKLPPISPQLPGLVNSLQDQQIRPLLAPLLIRPSEQTPTDDVNSDVSEQSYSSFGPSHISVSTTSTSTTTTTAAPIPETTTQFRRTRTRQRGTRPTVSYDYISTTANPLRASQHRGRRPSSSQVRQYSSTVHPEAATESSTRATFNRNRPVTQRQYIALTTEQPRNSLISSRQRFRTRGRPVKTDDDYSERNSPENVPVYKEESGFQASAPTLQSDVRVPNFEGRREPEITASQRPQKEQALIYIQSTSTPDTQDSRQLPDLYIPRQQYISSTESQELNHHSTIAATGPENNLVPDIVHDQPAIITAQQQIRTNRPTDVNQYYQENHSSEAKTNEQVPQTKYSVDSEYSNESSRTKIRTRGKTRPRPNPVVSTVKYEPSYSSTTTPKAANSKENDEEFYGFFRKPNFGKITSTEQQDPEIISSTQSPSSRINDYLSRTTEEPYSKQVYYNPVSSSHESYSSASRDEDGYVQPNTHLHRHSVSSTTDNSEESVADNRPITRRPAVRLRRPITSPTRSPDSASVSSEQSNDRYNYRTSKRPEIQTTRPTRIRSRIRIPTRPPAAIQNSETHSSRSNELGNNSGEYSTPTKTRQRLTNRGKSHFQLPKSEKAAEEPEEENYPVSFLQGQGIQRQSSTVSHSTSIDPTSKSVILTTSDSYTPRPSFQLTIEPVDAEGEYSDQIPYSSIQKPQVATKDLEHGGEESQFSSKFVEKPVNFNYIISDDKPTTEKVTETETSVPESVTTIESSSSEQSNDQIEVTTSKSIGVTVESLEVTSTEIPLTTTEYVTEKTRRRGVWRLVKARPVGEEFESAESQNIHSVLSDNEFSNVDKPIRNYKNVQRIRATTEPSSQETTTYEIPETTIVSLNEKTTQPTDKSSATGFLAPLYEMFGYDYNSQKDSTDENAENNDQMDATVNESSTVFSTSFSNVETTTISNNNSSNSSENISLQEEGKLLAYSDIMQGRESSTTNDTWESKVIGTSTSTEISHETEICYRGKCVKSTSTEDNSEAKL